MKISEERVKDVVILNIEGNLMGGPEAVSVNEIINRLLDEQSLKIVLCLENVERINSSGLGILIKALNTYKTNNGELKLACVNPKVANLLRITKLDSVLELCDTVEEAIERF